jgi:hypothetical protein
MFVSFNESKKEVKVYSKCIFFISFNESKGEIKVYSFGENKWLNKILLFSKLMEPT